MLFSTPILSKMALESTIIFFIENAYIMNQTNEISNIDSYYIYLKNMDHLNPNTLSLG